MTGTDKPRRPSDDVYRYGSFEWRLPPPEAFTDQHAREYYAAVAAEIVSDKELTDDQRRVELANLEESLPDYPRFRQFMSRPLTEEERRRGEEFLRRLKDNGPSHEPLP